MDISGTSGAAQLTLAPNTEGATEPDATQAIRQPAFVKVTHLLDPVRWMKGRYSLPRHSGLPWHSKTWTAASHKLQDPWNQAYVETMAAYALGRLREENASPHFNMFYGAFCARADRYLYNVTEDYGSYRNARWFWNGQRKGIYKLQVKNGQNPEEPVDPEILDEIMREPSVMSDEASEVSSESEEEIVLSEDEGAPKGEGPAPHGPELESLHSDDDMEEAEFMTETTPTENSATSGTDDESEDAEDYRIYAEFNDFPVMLIASEKNSGTMDGLLDNWKEVGAEPGSPEWEKRWSAWLFQVIAALCCAQSVLGFTHNDLHTNNIVWTPTQEEFLYYTTRAGTVFKVPTFGKLFRLIDFGRAIFRINQTEFISDDFRAGGDADGQYCFKPLHPRPPAGAEVYPNPSFDLCRLSVSLLESIFPEGPDVKEGGAVLSSEEGLEVRETVSPLYNVLWSWLVDDEGRNVLIEPDGEERFPDFDLYKHIAAKVHNAVPARQLTHPAFDQFQVATADIEADVRKWSLFV